jgi:hypothetical protein
MQVKLVSDRKIPIILRNPGLGEIVQATAGVTNELQAVWAGFDCFWWARLYAFLSELTFD